MRVVINSAKSFWKLVASAFVIFVLVTIFLYLIDQILDGQKVIWPLILLWALSAYSILPRIHRFLTKLYLPNYFIGRTRTGDGLYSDPVNIAVMGSAESLHKAMVEAGWDIADELSLKTTWKMTLSSIRKKSYKNAPVSSLYLFSRKQDFAYQKEINNNPQVRHHIRFWKTPSKWWLPGGYEADWLAAATFDKHVGISLYTGQITHKIEENTDEERDFVVSTLKETKHVEKVEYIKHFTTAFRQRSGGGDHIKTDGSLPFVYLK